MGKTDGEEGRKPAFTEPTTHPGAALGIFLYLVCSIDTHFGLTESTQPNDLIVQSLNPLISSGTWGK